jgi:hypothetical protein
MKKDKLFERLVSKMNEAAIVPPQDVGMLTPIYKKIVPQFKFYPWRMALIISMLSGFGLYFLFGRTLVKLASLLQAGF